MKSKMPGIDISEIEVVNIDNHGFWVFIKGEEYFLDYEHYPWFRDARISEILNVQLLHETHLYWPALDVDLTIEILNSPDKYSEIYQ